MSRINVKFNRNSLLKFAYDPAGYYSVPIFLREQPLTSGLYETGILTEEPTGSGLFTIPDAYLGDDSVTLDNIESFSVQEDATPIDPSSSFGGVGQISFDTLETDGARRLFNGITFVDGSRGRTSGSVKSISGSNGKTSIVADSILGLFNVDRTVPPFHGTFSEAINFYCSLVGIPNGVTVDASVSTRPVSYPGWKGNVWVGIKQILARERVEMALVFDRVYVRPIRTLVAHLDRSTSSSFSIDSTNAARSIDIHYYNNTYGEQQEVYPPTVADATIFQVDAGETVVFQERLNASLFSVNQPTVQDWVDDARYDGTEGVYSVVGNDGLPITAAQWTAQGGSVYVAITDDPSIIEVTIHGADMPNYAPYRIAMSSGSGNYYNSLHITGEAILSEEKVINIKTGVSNTVSSDPVGVVVSNPFISTKEEAYSLGMIVAGAYAGLNYSVSGTALDINRGEGSRGALLATIADFNLAVDAGTPISTFNTEWSGQDIADFNVYWQEQVDVLFGNQLFGNAIGARVFEDAANFRIVSATTKPDVIDYTANLDTIVRDFNNKWVENEQVLTNLAPNPRPQAVGGSTFELKRNFVPNPNFETDTDNLLMSGGTVSWTSFSPAVLVGSRAAGLAVSGDAPASAYQIIQGVTEGQWVGIRIPLRRSTGENYYRLRTIFRNAEGGWLNSPWGPYVLSQSNYSNIQTLVTQAPVGTTNALVRVYFYSDTSGSDPVAGLYHTDAWSAYVGSTQAEVEALLTQPYFDGDTTYDPLLVPSWTGTPGDSRSILTATIPAGWVASPGEQIALVTDGGEPAVALIDPAGNGGGYQRVDVAAAPGVGKWIAASIEFKSDVPVIAANADLRIQLLTGSTQDAISPVVSTPIAPGEWRRISRAVQQSVSTTNLVRIWARANNSVFVGEQSRVRRLVVAFADTEAEALASVSTYFDGATSPTNTTVYEWVGTPDASASTATSTQNRISLFNEEFIGYTCKDFSIEPLRRA